MVSSPGAEPCPRSPFRSRVWRGIFLFLTLAGLAPALRAEAPFSGPGVNSDSNIEIQLTQLLDRTPDYGFVPVRILIRNDSGKTRSWTFEFSTGEPYVEQLGLKQTHSIEVEAGKSKGVDLLVPLPGIPNRQSAERLRVNVTGYGIANSIGYASDRYANDPSAYVGMSRSLFTNQAGPAAESFKKQGYRYFVKNGAREDFITRRAGSVSMSSTSRELCNTILDFQKLPADWRTYSGLGGIQISEPEWRDLPKAQEQAILDWMALGGKLTVVGGSEDGEENVVPVGFGGRANVESGEPAAVAEALAKQAQLLDKDPVLPWGEDFSTGWGLVRVVGPLKTNTALIIGFVVLFAIIIAPVNLFVFAPSHLRHRLFWTVPLISVVAGVLLAGIIVIQEGFGGTGQRLTAVLILPEEHKMAVIQEQVVRTALLFEQRFPLPEKALFAALPVNTEGLPDGTVSRQEDWGGGDWFSSRTMRGYQLKAILPTRARVEMVGWEKGGAPVVLSSVPVTLKEFTLVDKSGVVWVLPELKTGQKSTLQPRKDKFEGLRDLLKKKASGNFRQTLMAVQDRPGYFYGLAGAGGGVPVDTLASIKWQDDQVVYLGAWTEAMP